MQLYNDPSPFIPEGSPTTVIVYHHDSPPPGDLAPSFSMSTSNAYGRAFVEEAMSVYHVKRRVNSFALVSALAVLACLVVGVSVLLPITTHSSQNTIITQNPDRTHTRVSSASSSAPQKLAGLQGVSKSLVRINQVDPAQYNSTLEFTTWWPSACSAASMTEIINAYGYHYRLTDILKVEAGLGEITPDAGLAEPQGLDKTLARFNFTTRWLNNPSVDDLIATANSGTPVIINFPPYRWAGGHLLVALGGNKDYVYLADSSKLNMRAMDRKTFLKYWVGFAVVATPAYSVLGTPTLSPDFINRVLSAHNSPASGKGQTLYNLGVKYGIDPAFALAFFGHESSFGKNGEARSSFSLGNLRCIPTTVCKDNYAWFPTWEAGFEAWYKLIHDLYVNAWGLTTIDQIIPRYAPPGDNNNDDAYIASLKLSLNTWHTGQI